MSENSLRALKIANGYLNEMGEALDGSLAVVDWTGTGGRDILYNTNPRFLGGRTYLYREDRTTEARIPVYHPAEILEGLNGRYCIVLKSNSKQNGFSIIMLEDDSLALYRNTGTVEDPVFGEKKEKIPFPEEFMDLIITKGFSVISIHSYNRADGITDIIVTCSVSKNAFWPDGKSPWGDDEHPNAGFGRGYDNNGVWKGRDSKKIVYVFVNSGTNEDPIYESFKEIYSFTSIDQIVDVSIIDLYCNGSYEMILRKDVDRLYNLKLDEYLKPVGNPMEMKCSPLKKGYFQTTFFPYDINQDGRVDIVVSGNSGTIFWLENKGDYLIERPPLLKRGGDVRVETLSVPCLVDMNNDGYVDMIVGDSSGYLWYFENAADSSKNYIFKPGKRIQVNGKEIQHQAGYSGSMQGPIESRWGYTNPFTVDWNGDGLIDIITNDVTGKIRWYRNIGTKTLPVFDNAVSITCDGRDLITAWRTRPALWNSNTLVVINIDGFAQFFEKDKMDLAKVNEGKLLRYVDGCAIRSCGLGGHLGRTAFYVCDWDGDGITDIVGGTHRDLTHNINAFFPRKATLFWIKNVGTNINPIFERPRLITLKDGTPIDLVCHNCSPWCIDIDDDGELDIVSGAEDGKIYVWLRKTLKWDWEPSKNFLNTT